MATVTDVEVANASFPNVRQDLNDILEAIATNFSADAEPTTTYPNQWWYETDTNKLYIRNEDNDAWIHVLTLDQTTDTVSSVEGVSADKIEEGNSSIEVIDTGTGYIQINVDGAEAARFDSSGNFLVSKTAFGFATVGTELRDGGLIQATRDGGAGLVVNRKTSDGELIGLYKDQSLVGSIGNSTTNLYLDSGAGAGLFIGSDSLAPRSGGSLSDNSIKLGTSSYRYTDLYLSGGVYLGGTGAANYLDDYEEGTWTPTVGSAGYTLSSSSGTYTKVGRIVHIFGNVLFSAVGAGNSSVVIGSAPFTNGPEVGTGVVREDTSTGAIYLYRVANGSTNMEINSMDGVTAGSQRTIRTGEAYRFHATYYVA